VIVDTPEVQQAPLVPRNLDTSTTITIAEETFVVAATDLEAICELGRGAYGVVEKVKHKTTGTIMAVKRIPVTANSIEQQRVLMDLDISMRSGNCPFTVQFYGALFMEGDVWICMEVMDTSLDKFYPKVFSRGEKMPENIIAKIAYSVSDKLHRAKFFFKHSFSAGSVLMNSITCRL
jgi:mitogen-activated protein kinase kinase 3